MSTTSLIIEHLIAGIQAAIWIIFLLLTTNLLPSLPDALENLEKVSKYSTFITLSMLALLYPLGIIIDNTSDFILKRFNNKLRALSIESESLNPYDKKISGMTLLHQTNDKFLETYLIYIRMRIRIVRSIMFNSVALTLVSLIPLVIKIHDGLRYSLILTIIGVGVALISFLTWRNLTKTFYKQIARGFKMLK